MSAVRIMTASRTYGELPAAYDDLTGRRFGHLTQWECACDCGGWTVKSSLVLHKTRNPDRLHCGRCEHGERIDWDQVLADNHDTIAHYRRSHT